MDVNLSNTYSLLSSLAEKDEQRLQNVIQRVEKLGQINSVEVAKKYIAENWNYSAFGRISKLCDDCTLYAQDFEDVLVLKFNIENDNIIFYYNK